MRVTPLQHCALDSSCDLWEIRASWQGYLGLLPRELAMESWMSLANLVCGAVDASRLPHLNILSICSGLCPEKMVLDALGVHHTISTCDVKESAAKFASTFTCHDHHFQNAVHMRDVNSSSVWCMKHSKMCPLPTCGSLDLMISGFPCQKYSRQNNKRSFHADDLTMAAVDILERFKPKAFILENVTGIV